MSGHFGAFLNSRGQKATKSIEGEKFPRVRPSNTFKGVMNVESIIEKDWTYVGIKGAKLAVPGGAINFPVTKSGKSRYLRSFEAEDLLGVGREASNYIEKIQEEKLEDREMRRKVLLLPTVPKAIATSVLAVVCPSPSNPS